VLRPAGYLALPEHAGGGGFDHAAIHAATGQIYVAHTANDAIDVVDPASGHLFSVPDLPGVAGVVISDELGLVITTNRAENTIALFPPGADPRVRKVAVGVRPNGLACDPLRRLVLVANVGDPAVPGSHTLSVVDLDALAVVAEIGVPGRTRWVVHDRAAEAFYVNLAEPPTIVVVRSRDPRAIAGAFPVPAPGPHGLDLDPEGRRLFCACDGASLVTLDARSGNILARNELSGVPDVVFFNPALGQVYVAIGDPGVIHVFDTAAMARRDRVRTEKDAHTLAFDAARGRVYALLPDTHRAAVYRVEETRNTSSTRVKRRGA